MSDSRQKSTRTRWQHRPRAPRHRSLLPRRRLPRPAVRRAVRHGGAHHRHLLPALLPCRDPEAGQRRVLADGGRGPAARLPRLPALPARRRARLAGLERPRRPRRPGDAADRRRRRGAGRGARSGRAPRVLRAPSGPGAQRRAGRRSAGAGPRAPRAHRAAAGGDDADGDGGRRLRVRVRQRAAVQRHGARGLRGAADHAAHRGRTARAPGGRRARSCCGCPSGRRSTPPGCWRSSRRGPWVGSRRWTAARTGGRCGCRAGRRWWRSTCRCCRTSQRSHRPRRGDRLCEDVRGPARTARHRRSRQDGARAHGRAGPRRRATPTSSRPCASPTRATWPRPSPGCGGCSTSTPTRRPSTPPWPPIPVLAPGVAAVPGIRLPGTVDPAETALRAVLGQQVSVAAARTAAARLAAALGERLPPALAGDGPDLLFPTAAHRRRARRGRADRAGPADRDRRRARRGARRRDARARRRARPRRAARRAHRAAGHRPVDRRLPGDPRARRPRRAAGRATWPCAAAHSALGIDDLPRHAARWAPWRSYAALHLWRASTPDQEIRMTCTFATLDTPAGPFTAVVDADGAVLASGLDRRPRHPPPPRPPDAAAGRGAPDGRPRRRVGGDHPLPRR